MTTAQATAAVSAPIAAADQSNPAASRPLGEHEHRVIDVGQVGGGRLTPESARGVCRNNGWLVVQLDRPMASADGAPIAAIAIRVATHVVILATVEVMVLLPSVSAADSVLGRG